MSKINYTDMYTIAVNNSMVTHPNYYGKGRHIPLFETKEDAQLEIDTYYPRTIILVKKVKVMLFVAD